MQEISIHQARVFRFIRDAQGWVTSKAIAAGASVAERTARHHAKGLSDLGLVETKIGFPSHLYRLSPKLDKAGVRYRQLLEELVSIYSEG